MKKIKWGALAIGFISNVGLMTIGVIVIALLWALLAASIVGTDGLRYIMHRQKDLPIFIILLIMLLSAGSTMISAWITARLSRPFGLYNAMILACVFAAFALLGGLGGWGIIRVIAPFPLCWFGAMFVHK